MTQNAMPLEYRSSRWHSFLWLAVAAPWLWAGTTLIHDEPWMPILAFALAAVSLYVGVTNLLRPAIVRLDRDGVHFRHWRMAWFVAWADIAEVRLSTVGINGFRASQNVILRECNGTDRRISSGLTISQARLAELIAGRQTFV